MNASRRKALRDIRDKLQDLRAELEAQHQAEEEAAENLPDGLRESEQGQKMQGNAQCLEDALDHLDNCISNIGEADIE